MTSSLRGRLFIGLTAVILLTGAASAVITYRWAFDEAIEMQDSILIQIARLAQDNSFGRFSGSQPLQGVDEDAEVWVLELGRVPQGSADDRDLWSFKDGLHVATRNGESIRALLGTRGDGTRFVVAQPTGIRDETARGMALRTLLPIAALIPCLMLVTALVIAMSLRSTRRLAEDLDARRPDDMTSLPLAGTPSELHPFIASINGLLQRMQRMIDQQRRFVADAAHELRSPITALSLQAENLNPVDLPKTAQDRLATLKQGIHRTKHLLEQLLALARHETWPGGSREMPLIGMDRAAKEVVADLLPLALDRGIDLGFQLVEPLNVRSEPVMLAAMIRNLVDNALRFAPQGGRIDLGVYQQDGAAMLQIEDSGPGIAPADVDRIFEPFFRGQRPGEEGTGLGLSIVKRVVDGLGGSITLENIADIGRSGLRVTVRLPIAADPNKPTGI
jgi:two-component system OmpR family sensor kinase